MSRILLILGLVLLMTVPVSVAQAGSSYDGSGTAVISDGSSLSDRISYSMTGVTRLDASQAYEGWLVNSSSGAQVSTGVMKMTGLGDISHSWVSPDGANLLDGYDTVMVSVEAVPDADASSPSGTTAFTSTVAAGTLSTVRGLVASDGALTGLRSSLDSAIASATSARSAASLADLKTHTESAIASINGDSGAIAHAASAQTTLGDGSASVSASITNASGWATEAHDGALEVLNQDSLVIAQALLTNVSGSLDAARNGMTSNDKGGAEQAYSGAQALATYNYGGAAGVVLTPSVGDTTIPMMAQMALALAFMLITSGGLLYARSKR